MAYERFDVVVVPFPFTDKATQKRRPAVVLSSAKNFNDKARHSVMAMITSVGNPSWALDVPIKNLPVAGLPAPSVVRMKLFTLDHKFVIRRAGKLATPDQSAVKLSLDKLFG